ncbi:AT-hook motif nuclear-localized protein 10-like [Malania oleifera]|uniref:AT-hook motif nuclear-localized protein 10-like n=1 Tax=Malania oleifera TaxID=397392 RepID=UPI0025ADB741|nr:AT-hook motif nuclear-localized protein 10-like [Malania oleifera]XP_057979813.1 AT-hook motif nuclear-localized protein 10-like [Malania oleifera]XP_057979821.1 AT-hook motif nuclear-localized protein 10-like [Malania oleifera]
MSSGREYFLSFQSQAMQPNMRLAFSANGAAVYKPVVGSPPTPSDHQSASGGGGCSDGSAVTAVQPPQLPPPPPMSGLRKRGRPRKYAPDVSSISINAISALASTPAAPASSNGGGGGGGFSPPPPPPLRPPVVAAASSSTSSAKKARGRTPGSASKRPRLAAALESARVGFTPHIIRVMAGEDISSKIMSFSQNGPRAVCILSANGVISNVTVRQQATSGGTVTYEGRFEILSLSGSFLLSESVGQRGRIGGLSVSLAGPDGQVLGGGVAGPLTAACPVQVVIGSFMAGGQKDTRSGNSSDPYSAPPKQQTPGPTAVGSPSSHGTLSESPGGPGSPLNHGFRACENNNTHNFSLEIN